MRTVERGLGRNNAYCPVSCPDVFFLNVTSAKSIFINAFSSLGRRIASNISLGLYLSVLFLAHIWYILVLNLSVIFWC